MREFSTHIFMFLIPGIAGNVLHMLVVRKNMFPFLAEPLSVRLFGRNKTYRGFIFLPFAIGSICLAESLLAGPFSSGHLRDLFIGLGLGFFYMLSELPNSFFKRMAGIPSGGSSADFRIVQAIADKSDSLIGASIFYYFSMKPEIREIILLFLISLVLHFSISRLLVVFKLKKSL